MNFHQTGLLFKCILFSYQKHNRPLSATWSNYHVLMSYCASAEFMLLISDNGKIKGLSWVLCSCGETKSNYSFSCRILIVFFFLCRKCENYSRAYTASYSFLWRQCLKLSLIGLPYHTFQGSHQRVAQGDRIGSRRFFQLLEVCFLLFSLHTNTIVTGDCLMYRLVW